MESKKYVLILASGGIDSTACINFYKNLDFDVEALYINYGQSAYSQEYLSIQSICEFYKIKLLKVNCVFHRLNKGYMQGRNAFLYFTGLMNFSRPFGTIASGVHSGTNYYDCSNKFISTTQQIFDGYTHGSIKLGTPFLNFNKFEIIDYSLKESVPLHLTYSCEIGGIQPCGICDTCKDLEQIYASKKQ